MDKKKLKEEIKQIKLLCKTSESFEDLHNSLENRYERITNRTDINYDLKYNAMEFFNSKTLKTIKLIKSKKPLVAVVFEFTKQINTPNNFAIIYNEFNDNLQTKIDIYITK